MAFATATIQLHGVGRECKNKQLSSEQFSLNNHRFPFSDNGDLKRTEETFLSDIYLIALTPKLNAIPKTRCNGLIAKPQCFPSLLKIPIRSSPS